MQKYKYTALNLQNEKIRGVFLADNDSDLAAQLARQGLYLVSAKPYNGAVPSAFFTLSVGKTSLGELTTFCRQFAIMLRTRIPILDCLDILRNQQYTAYFKKILQVVYEDVKSGILLSAALEKHQKNFPDFFRSMVYVGEMSGKLDLVFLSLADYYEKDTALKRKVKGAMAYPLVLLFMTVGIAALMLFMVVPTFRESMQKMDVTPTGITKVVYDISDFVLAFWPYFVLVLFSFVGIGFLALRTERGKYAFDYLKVKLPLISRVQNNMTAARFSRAFGLLLASGMDLAEAMDTVEIIIGNRYTREKFRRAAESIRHGMSLSHAFESHGLFPPMMLQMIAIGERTATLEDVLAKSCEFFDTQVEVALSSLTSKILPTMLLLMGGIVGTLFIAVYSPMLTIMNGIGV